MPKAAPPLVTIVGRGNPAGKIPVYSTRLPKELTERIRSSSSGPEYLVLRVVIEAGLEALERKGGTVVNASELT